MIAIWGEGSSGKRYQEIVESLGYEVVLLKRPSQDEQFQITDALAAKLDAAIICTPTSLHAEQAAELIKRFVPVLCEKPIASTSQDGKYIIDLAKRKDVKFHPGYNQRFFTAYDIFRNNNFGNLQYARSVWRENVSKWQPDKDYRQSYAVRTELGGGVPLTLSHDFDWWSGIVSGLAVKSVNKFSNNSSLNIFTEYEVNLISDDVLIEVELDYDTTPSQRYYEAVFEKGTLKYYPYSSSLKYYQNGGEIIDFNVGGGFDIVRYESFRKTFLNFWEDQRSVNELSDWELGISALELAVAVDNNE